MVPKTERPAARRQPKQRRARNTVETILDAVIRVLKRDGLDAVTTNRVAEVAGVSIGSIYQYFPDKRAIFIALHERYVQKIDRLLDTKLLESTAESLDDLVRGTVEAMIQTHASDPELHQLLMTEVPHRAEGTRAFALRLHDAFRRAIVAIAKELRDSYDLDKVVFVVTHIVEALSHGAALQHSPGLSLSAAKEEAVKAVLTYLRARESTSAL